MTHSSKFYKKLRKVLEETTTFPTKYLFKFIVPITKNQHKEVEAIFNYKGAVITTKDSKNKNFKSITVLIEMKNADEVISKYIEAEKIEGIISL